MVWEGRGRRFQVGEHMYTCGGFISIKIIIIIIKPSKEKEKLNWGNSLVAQWVGLRTLTAEAPGSIPGSETKILQAVWCGQNNYNKTLNWYCF